MDNSEQAQFSRRGFLRSIAGAAATWPLTGCRARKANTASEEIPGDYTWSGIGFGIEMSMELHGMTVTAGDRLGADCERIIRDLEQVFSLYQEGSELSQLNRERVLTNPGPHFRKLLGLAVDLHARTLGYYQPAIHGAWTWLENRGSTADLKEDPRWNEQFDASDLKYLDIQANGSIRLLNPLTRLSMNAIGQGYLADVVASHLLAAGVVSGLLHLGESYAIGRHPEGRFWKLAVTGTPANGETGLLGNIEFSDAGLAVSAQDADRLLIDPVSRSVHRQARVAAVVSREGACVADAYATAFAVAPEKAWPQLAGTLKRAHGSQVRLWVENELSFSFF